MIFSPERSGIESQSVSKVFSSLNSEITVIDYTYVKVLINNEWWIRVYDDKGILVTEYPDE